MRIPFLALSPTSLLTEVTGSRKQAKAGMKGLSPTGFAVSQCEVSES